MYLRWKAFQHALRKTLLLGKSLAWSQDNNNILNSEKLFMSRTCYSIPGSRRQEINCLSLLIVNTHYSSAHRHTHCLYHYYISYTKCENEGAKQTKLPWQKQVPGQSWLMSNKQHQKALHSLKRIKTQQSPTRCLRNLSILYKRKDGPVVKDSQPCRSNQSSTGKCSSVFPHFFRTYFLASKANHRAESGASVATTSS